MKIGLITTLDTNIGDDFIREGICNLLRSVFHDRELEFVPVNKHQPFTVFDTSHPARLAQGLRLPVGGRFIGAAANLLAKTGKSRFDDCGLIVQCGAPVLWPDCNRCEWAEPLWSSVIGRLHEKTPVLNLAAGSCYPWEKQPEKIDNPLDARFLRTISSYCVATTARDTLARKLFASIGVEAKFLPCTALLAGGTGRKPGGYRDFILINYMPGGGHYDWGQRIDPSSWDRAMSELISNLKKKHKVAMLCHNETEKRAASELVPDLPIIFPKTPEEYFSVVAGAKAAVCNRLHASVGMAGIGIPSIAIGTDTRLLMVDAIGVPALYVKDATLEKMEESLNRILVNREAESQRLLALRERVWKEYVELIRNSLKKSAKQI
jgi:hypothetical protein